MPGHEQPTRLYFAYGSNLNAADWEDWCRRNGFPQGLLAFHSCGYLPDWDLAFDHFSTSRQGGALNIRPRVGQVVPGVIFEVRGDGWHALDQKEGAPRHYRRIDTVAQDDNGQLIRVSTYRARGCGDHVPPTDEYLKIVRKALEHHGFDSEMLQAAATNQQTPWTTDAVFCYGTLMRGESRFPTLARCDIRCILLAEACGRLVDLGSFPGRIHSGESDGRVQGEFIRLGDFGEAVPTLDAIEGFRGYDDESSLYRRVLIGVGVGEGRVRLAWTYVLGTHLASAPVIPSADWREHRGSRDEFLRALLAAYAQTLGQDGWGSLVRRLQALDAGPQPWDSTTLFEALRDGRVSERRLAQATGHWHVVP